MTPTTDRNRISYDDQANVFENRTGLPAEIARQVADAVCDYAGLGPGDLIVEIGAGTGVIGQWLARPPYRYLGFDSSQPMLDVFRPRLRPDDKTMPSGGAPAPQVDAALLHADADARWPLADRTAAAIFGSRVLHLLRAEHLLKEAERVARPGGAVLICGRLERDPSSPRSAARKKLRELLAGHGLQPRPTGGRPTRLFAQAEAEGADILAPRLAAAWPDTVGVTEVLDGWRGKTSLGGINPPADVAQAVLAALTAWAAETYGEPAAPVTTETRYVLEGIRLRAGPLSAGAERP